MIYAYRCPECAHDWDVWKPAAEFDRPEVCPTCSAAGTRLICAPVGFCGEKIQDREAEFNHGLGAVTRNKAHRSALAKQKGLEEIGNTSAESLHTQAESVQKQRLSWDRTE